MATCAPQSPSILDWQAHRRAALEQWSSPGSPSHVTLGKALPLLGSSHPIRTLCAGWVPRNAAPSSLPPQSTLARRQECCLYREL